MKKFLPLFILIILTLPSVSFAQNTNTGCPNNGTPDPTTGACNLGYTPLEPIPGITSGYNIVDPKELPTLISSLFRLLITFGALFAVLMLTIGGVQYMVSESTLSKTVGLARARAAVVGILLIAITWLILHTINPNLLTFTFNPCPPGANCSIAPDSLATLDTTQQYQNAVNAARNTQHSASDCAAAQQWLNANGGANGVSVQAADIRGQLLRGRSDDGTLLTDDQKANLRAQQTQLEQQTMLNIATVASCNGGQ